MSDNLKVFISTVSSQFKDCREALASDLRAIGCDVKVQEDFQQGPDTLIAQIEDYVDQCDRVIALVGDAYGCEAAKQAVPITEPPRSYTQWEYYFAQGERLNGDKAESKNRYVYFASPDYLKKYPVKQSAEFIKYQSGFCQMLKDSGKHRGEFGGLDQLCRMVLRDGWDMNERPKPCNLPYDTLGKLFKGRDGFIGDLHEHLQQTPGRAAAVVAKQAIHGLGGVGKTRLAIEYALRFKAEYCAFLFVGADSQEALNRNLAALCELLNLPEHEATEEEVRATAAKHWFAEHSGWLLILDNVDTTAAADAVKELFKQLQEGHVLVTSRLSNWSGGIDTLELDVLNESDAVTFILEWTQQERAKKATDSADALALAKELGGLILALEQAGAFIKQRHLAIADYLERWRERETNVLKWFDKSLMNYPRSFAVTWDASVNQLDTAAFGLLQILCWFAAEPIPRELLRVSSAEQQLADILSLVDVNAVEKAKPDLEDALSMLAGFSLVKWEDNNSAFSLHRLVADISCSRISNDQRDAWLTAALVWVNDYLPSDPPPGDVRSWPLWEPLRGHLTVLIEKAVAQSIAEPTARLANDLASLLFTQGQWKEAEPLMRRALAIDETSYGAEHPSVAIDLNNLAALLKATNRLEEAEPLMRRALAIDESSYGAEHPNVAIRLNNLALLLQATNRLEEAEPLMRRALAIDESSYGAEHPDVAIDLNNLAQLLKDTNRLEEAEPLMRRALAIDESSYGAEHPNVARDLNNLAALLQDTNRLEEAEPLMRRALAIDETSYGAEHPNVARDLNNLAALLQDTNRLEEAEPLMRRALAIDESSYGAEHPNVAIRLNNLALLLQATNRLEEAEPLMRRALAIDESSYGAEHPDVAIDLNNLAALLQDTNRLEEAEPLMRRALAIDESSYGAEHPNVARDLNNLALLLQDTNRLEEAEPLMRRALAIDESSYGAEHPNVARDLNNLALLLQATNRLEEAEPLMRRALAIDETSYGAGHPNVARGLSNLAALLQDTNRLEEAEPLMRKSLEIILHSCETNGYLHPQLQNLIAGYNMLLVQMGRTETEAFQHINAIAKTFGLSLGSGD